VHRAQTWRLKRDGDGGASTEAHATSERLVRRSQHVGTGIRAGLAAAAALAAVCEVRVVHDVADDELDGRPEAREGVASARVPRLASDACEGGVQEAEHDAGDGGREDRHRHGDYCEGDERSDDARGDGVALGRARDITQLPAEEEASQRTHTTANQRE